MRTTERFTGYCELCGAPGAVRIGDLEECPRCGMLACPPCRPFADACSTCATALRWSSWRAGIEAAPPPGDPVRGILSRGFAGRVSTPAPSADVTRPSDPTPVLGAWRSRASMALIAVGVLCMIAAGSELAVLAVQHLGTGTSGAVTVPGEEIGHGPQSADGAPHIAASPGATPPLTGDVLRAGDPDLAVRRSSVPTWQDALGAWHGQALAAIRNTGAQRVAVDAAASQYTVLSGDGSTVTYGPFQAAIPPVLAPGATAYLVAGFTLAAAPGEDLQVQVAPAGRPSDEALVALRVSHVRVAYRGDTVIATGDVGNPGTATITSGAVGVVLLNAAGRPLAAVLDLASASRLDGGEWATFRAAAPPAPPVDRAAVSRRIASAWGVPAP